MKSKNTFKAHYKAIMSKLRIEAMTNRAATVDILINLKSHNINPYEGKNREWLTSVLKKQKGWNGDLRYYLQGKYPDCSGMPSHNRNSAYSNQYNRVYVDEMPF